MHQNQASKTKKGFSMVEMLIVLTIVGLLMAFTAPSLLTLKSTSLSAAGREFGAFISLCRSEAISDRNALLLGIVVESTEEEEILRRYAAWKWDKRAISNGGGYQGGSGSAAGGAGAASGSGRQRVGGYVLHSEWNSLPQSVVFEDQEPRYIRSALYAEQERSAVRGDHVLFDNLDNEFVEVDSTGASRTIRFLKFSPTGRASLPIGEERNILIVIKERDVQVDQVKNWVQFTLDTLTGRTRAYRP